MDECQPLPAGCAFGDVEVPGEYLWASSQVTCVSPPVDRAAAVEMRVTLNGQIYSNDTIIYRYGFVGGINGRVFHIVHRSTQRFTVCVGYDLRVQSQKRLVE